MDFKNILIDELLKRQYSRMNSNKSELMMRCPFCGDSIKHANSTHLYIKMPESDKEPFLYYCQRCKSSGIIDKDFFRALKIKDSSLLIDVISYNKKATKNKPKYSKSMSKRYLFIPNVIKRNKLNVYKLNYINQRLGINLTFNDLERYKIILNLYDLLDINNIQTLSCKEKMSDTLDKNFIGFVSFDNNYIIMRNLSKTNMKEMRYYNYNIFNMHENSKRFYVIPTEFDLLNSEVNIVLTEGVFDILSVYFNIKKKENKNTIYAAVGGVGYEDVIRQLVRYSGCLNFSLEIYGDSDQPLRFYQNIIKNIPHLVNKFTLYQNSLEKDFGVPLDCIKISKKVIK